MNVSLFIALRYLRSKRTLNFITIISAIATAGIAIGVAALIVILSVFNGFQSLVERFLIGFDPHVRVSAARGGSMPNADSVAAKIQSTLQPMQGRKAVSASQTPVQAVPVISGKIVTIKAKSMLACQLYGISETRIDAVSGVRKATVAGEFALARRDDGLIPVVMGIVLADKLRLATGDTLSLLPPSAIEAAIVQGSVPLPRRAVLVGLFQSNNKDYDAWHVYAAFDAAAELLGVPQGAAQSVDVRCESNTRSDEAATLLRSSFGDAYRVETWFDLHRDLYTVMRFERLAAFAVLTIIILVAVFNIFASLSMSVAEKRSEIGMLKAMGASVAVITRIFFVQAIIAAVVGVGAGIVLGVALCLGQERFGWFALDGSRYIIPAIPVVLLWADVAAVAAVALVLAAVASIIPAWRAGKAGVVVAMLRKERA